MCTVVWTMFAVFLWLLRVLTLRVCTFANVRPVANVRLVACWVNLTRLLVGQLLG